MAQQAECGTPAHSTGHDHLAMEKSIAQETILEFLADLAERKKLIAATITLAFAVGLVLCFFLPVQYTAVTKIMPPKQLPSMANLLISQAGAGALSPSGAASLLGDPNSVYIGLLRSRPIADDIIRKFDLQSVYNVRNMTAARKTLSRHTSILSEPSTFISIAVTDRDRKRATDIANTYAEQLRGLSKTISVSEASRRRAFFEEQLEIQKKSLMQAEITFQEVQQNKGLVHLDGQAGVLINSLATLRGQIAGKEVELQALRSFSTENNPDVQLAKQELAGLRDEALQMEGHGHPSGYSEIALRDVPAAGLDYLRAQREVQYQQAFFDILLRQFEGAKLDEVKDAAVIQIVEAAIEPDQQSSPRKLLILATACFIGLFGGCMCAVVLNRLELERLDPEGSATLRRLRRALLR